MAQTQRRMIYTKIWSSAQFGKLSDRAKLLFIGTITLADDDGFLIGTPSYLRGQIFPFDESISVTETLHLRNEIEEKGLFSTYKVEDIEYIEHPKWEEYQKIRTDLYKKSTLPKRNETVTKPLQKSSLSKDKISKDKYISTKVDDSLKVKKKEMWNHYNEDEHYKEKEIDIDSNEPIPTSKVKKPRESTPHVKLAIDYIKYRGFTYKSDKEYWDAVYRYMKPASLIVKTHTRDEILECMKWCKNKYEEWSLETVAKKINEYKYGNS